MKKVTIHGLLILVATLLAACGGAPTASPAPQSSAPAASLSLASAKPAASTAASAKPAAPFAGERSAIRFGMLNSVTNATTFVSADTGQFAAQGIDITLQPFTDTVQIMVSVGSGQLDMGSITLGAAALNALNRGLDLKVLASSANNPPSHGAAAPAIARTDLYDSGALTTPAQLKGRKFSINAKGNILEYSTAKLLARGGLKPSDVEMVYMPFPDMVAALGNKSIDAGMMLEPTATLAISKGVGKLLSDDYSPNTQNAVIIANGKFAEQHRDALERYLQVYIQAIRKFDDGGLKKDDQALSIVEKYTKVTPDITRKVPDTYWPKDGRINVESLQDQQNYYLQIAKSVDYTQPLDFAKLIDYSYLDAALKKIGG